jgi:hypothetical protein
VDLAEELGRIASAAAAYADPGEEVAAVVAAEPSSGRRTYLCAFERNQGRTWLALDETGAPVTERDVVREAVSIAAACEVAEETAGETHDPFRIRIASPAYLDRLGAEHGPAFVAALRDAMPVVDELAREIESQYKLPL